MKRVVGSSHGVWFHRPKPPGFDESRCDCSPTRLFCFPHAGGGGQNFHTWARDLPRYDVGTDVIGVQLPGRTCRISEKPLVRMEALLAQLLPAMEPLLDRPFAFFGHSLGALVAFETARALRRMGVSQPSALIVSGCVAPELQGRDSPIHGYNDDAFVQALAERYGGDSAKPLRDPELRKLALPSLKADFELLECWSYQPGEPLDVPIMALGGVDDQRVSAADLTAWQSETKYRLMMHRFVGGHFFLSSQRPQIIAVMKPFLQKMLVNPV